MRSKSLGILTHRSRTRGP